MLSDFCFHFNFAFALLPALPAAFYSSAAFLPPARCFSGILFRVEQDLAVSSILIVAFEEKFRSCSFVLTPLLIVLSLLSDTF